MDNLNEGYDVIIVGAGPAGLNAAIFLARCCRKILLFDDGHPRNIVTRRLHGFLTRDGIPPTKLRQIGMQEVEQYGVQIIPVRVASAQQNVEGFIVSTEDQKTYRAKKILLATGFHDRLPDIPGTEVVYGHGLYHCPYCDAYEYRDKIIAALGYGHEAVGTALSLRSWSEHVYAFTNRYSPDENEQNKLRASNIQWFEDKVTSFTTRNTDPSVLGAVELETGLQLECDAIFFSSERHQQSPLAEQLGCEFANHSEVQTERTKRTRTPGVFLAGDADGDVQFAIVAAADGACAAVAIHRELLSEEQEERLRRYERV